ncbi:hypothetical protein B296_00009362 [Ensete ventricosum]|uniref:Uncharacterized protein n=1 Tax=Ensete ventricosum TaxID=4639 RepID=A0A426ZD63_ENSVE|nr:hypothetical protein B296_00009362 [Ensete ventricosum]
MEREKQRKREEIRRKLQGRVDCGDFSRYTPQLQSTYWHDDGQRAEHILQKKIGVIVKQEILHIYSGLRLQSTKGAAPEGTSAHHLRLFKLGAANCSHIHALLPPEEHEETPEDHTQRSALQFHKAAVTAACDQSVFTNSTGSSRSFHRRKHRQKKLHSGRSS